MNNLAEPIHYYSFFSILAGTPPTTHLGGTSCVTTALQPIIAPSPILTPERIATRSPIHTLFPMCTGPLVVRRRSEGGIRSWSAVDSPCAWSEIITYCPVNKLSPIVISLMAVIWHAFPK